MKQAWDTMFPSEDNVFRDIFHNNPTPAGASI
jgi:hypothetical protein